MPTTVVSAPRLVVVIPPRVAAMAKAAPAEAVPAVAARSMRLVPMFFPLFGDANGLRHHGEWHS